MDGEESGNEGRGFAHSLDGTSWELPALGRFSWENSIANPSTGDTTVTVGTDDSTPGQVYVYVGTKTTTGSPVERAGLTNGKLYGVKVPGVPSEPAAGVPSSAFELANLGSRVGKTGTQLEAESNAALVTRFNRPEDASWDPTNPNVFYFVTTNAIDAPSRLWRLTFADVRNPAAGGRIEMVLDGTEGQLMMDNITVDDRGNVLIQEDVGGNAHIGKVFKYFPDSDTLTEVAHHDENRFAPGAPNFLTIDEESSGIIPAPFLGEGWYLLDVQAHYATDAETVEGGQLLALHVPPGRTK
jgi:secreted PhoX family phosphatase